MKMIACVCTILLASLAIATPPAVAIPWRIETLGNNLDGASGIDLSSFYTHTEVAKKSRIVVTAIDDATGKKVVLYRGRMAIDGELPRIDFAKAYRKFGEDATFSVTARTKGFGLQLLPVDTGTGGGTGGDKPIVEPGSGAGPGTGDPPGAPVPEPGTLLMLGMGLVGLAKLGMKTRGRK